MNIPTADDFTSANEVIVHLDAEPDDHGIARFTAFWRTDQPSVPGGVRAQVYNANLDMFTARHERNGDTVRVARIGGTA